VSFTISSSRGWEPTKTLGRQAIVDRCLEGDFPFQESEGVFLPLTAGGGADLTAGGGADLQSGVECLAVARLCLKEGLPSQESKEVLLLLLVSLSSYTFPVL
jgi:hypothetical protein